ncbi:MAG: hypothetical protein HGA44_13620, partial [Cellulomonadaceae bacterium]|nr:hypothetical protein [Cellulomonadaceae bacterium]
VYGLGTAPLEQVQTDDGTVDFLHTDLIGSVRSTTDATGQVTSDADYDAYGRPQPVTDTPVATITRFGYAGEYTDPTGLTYLRARYYDPQSAQFLSVDPLVADTRVAYGYAADNPLQQVDPRGLRAMIADASSANVRSRAVVSTVASAVACDAVGSRPLHWTAATGAPVVARRSRIWAGTRRFVSAASVDPPAPPTIGPAGPIVEAPEYKNYGTASGSACVLVCFEIGVIYDGRPHLSVGASAGPEIGIGLKVGGGRGVQGGVSTNASCTASAGPVGVYASGGVGGSPIPGDATWSGEGGWAPGARLGCSVGLTYTW